MTEPWFSSLVGLIEEKTGVSIDGEKQYLAHARLTPLLARFDMATLAELVDGAVGAGSGLLCNAVIDAMMTGETFFFRDSAQFTEIRNTLLPELLLQNADTRKLRIWCAACSTGQEPYSIAMMLDEAPEKLRGWDVEILATDVSTQALQRATSGLYNQFEVQRGLPVISLLKYFDRHEDYWRISARMRSKITFRAGNLMDTESAGEPFDLILCRNVLMYFSAGNRIRALRKLDRQLAAGGRLVLGTSESSIAHMLKYSASTSFPSIFQKAADDSLRASAIGAEAPKAANQ